MQTKIVGYIVVLVTAILLDGIWLGVISRNFYKKYIGFLLSPAPDVKVAFLFYIVFALAVMVFIISPALAPGFGLGKVLIYGALLGLVIYGGYDFTNQAIIKDWPWIVTAGDLSWGIVMSTLTAGISYSLIQIFR